MQNQTTVHASVALFAVVALVFWSGEFEPLSTSLDWLCERVTEFLHVDFWKRIAGVPEIS